MRWTIPGPGYSVCGTTLMWARTQLKIGWLDLLAGAISTVYGADRDKLTREVEAYWGTGGDTIAAYSVRSGFDVMLQAMDLNPGDEVIFSALNVKGMVKIVRKAAQSGEASISGPACPDH